ncbi:MAG: aminoglycoside phosphotransferase family protein [Eubacteriales bacterium]|nr:aminoglycoside phosphotransferase family protein [Eubacteriales bacterium]
MSDISFVFSQDESNKLIKHFGQEFYQKVSADIKTYSEKWHLEIEELVDYFSVNCIFKCKSAQFGNCILKIGRPSKWTIAEFQTLIEYSGNRFCKAFNADIDNGIILEEQINPGIRLRDEKSLIKRLSVFSELYNGLHIESNTAEIYPTYFDWVNRITKYMNDKKEYNELYLYMCKARDICVTLRKSYSKKLLLHGDFHHDNILLSETGQYKIIDPKGVVDDPIFDIPRFILNEFYDNNDISFVDYQNHIEKVIDYLENSLKVPSDIIKKCVFIETVMANCWNVESNESPDMNSVIYSDAVMNS